MKRGVNEWCFSHPDMYKYLSQQNAPTIIDYTTTDYLLLDMDTYVGNPVDLQLSLTEPPSGTATSLLDWSSSIRGGITTSRYAI